LLLCAAILVVTLAATRGPLRAQATTEMTGVLAAGWSALDKGRADEAATVASPALDRDPQNTAIATLLVAAELTRSGSAAGLNAYSRWLGTRTLENPYLLSPIAMQVLREVARQPTVADEIKRQAYQALADAGDISALSELGALAQRGDLTSRAVLAARGSQDAAQTLITDLQNMPGDKGRFIKALTEARNPAAIAPLTDLLKDQNSINRAAAADALGKLGATTAIPQLRALLNAPEFDVRFSAAAALYRLKDRSGESLFQGMLTSEHTALRAKALEAKSVDPDARWQSDVRSLLGDPDPQVRMMAASLIAPYDPEAARLVLQGLMLDNNIAIQELASQTWTDVVRDVATIRPLLRSGDPLTRVKAARRLLELTR
jgi:HEAT repeat protein